MAEQSLLWTTGSSGDGASTYTRADWSIIGQIFAACSGYQGVAPSYLNELAGTVTGANTVAINTGGAVVDGKPYNNSSSVNVNIPSASGGGNTRIDRIVLRANWSAQTVRITRIAGTDAASPSAPAITQTSGTTYDIMLYQALVNTSGTVTLTDEKVWAMLDVDDSTIEHSAGTLRIKDDGVTTAKILDANVTTAKIANLGVTLAKLAADSVDDTKAGNRVPQFYRRQGGSATNWDTAGTTARTPTAVRMQGGKISLGNINAGADASVSITFPVAFGNAPLVIATADPTTNSMPVVIVVSGQSTTQCALTAFNVGSSNTNVEIAWFAIGDE